MLPNKKHIAQLVLHQLLQMAEAIKREVNLKKARKQDHQLKEANRNFDYGSLPISAGGHIVPA